MAKKQEIIIKSISMEYDAETDSQDIQLLIHNDTLSHRRGHVLIDGVRCMDFTMGPHHTHYKYSFASFSVLKFKWSELPFEKHFNVAIIDDSATPFDRISGRHRQEAYKLKVRGSIEVVENPSLEIRDLYATVLKDVGDMEYDRVAFYRNYGGIDIYSQRYSIVSSDIHRRKLKMNAALSVLHRNRLQQPKSNEEAKAWLESGIKKLSRINPYEHDVVSTTRAFIDIALALVHLDDGTTNFTRFYDGLAGNVLGDPYGFSVTRMDPLSWLVAYRMPFWKSNLLDASLIIEEEDLSDTDTLKRLAEKIGCALQSIFNISLYDLWSGDVSEL